MKDGARTWNKRLSDKLSECDLKEMDTSPCVFVCKKAVNMCYVNELILFAKYKSAIDASSRQLDNKFRVNVLSKP